MRYQSIIGIILAGIAGWIVEPLLRSSEPEASLPPAVISPRESLLGDRQASRSGSLSSHIATTGNWAATVSLDSSQRLDQRVSELTETTPSEVAKFILAHRLAGSPTPQRALWFSRAPLTGELLVRLSLEEMAEILESDPTIENRIYRELAKIDPDRAMALVELAGMMSPDTTASIMEVFAGRNLKEAAAAVGRFGSLSARLQAGSTLMDYWRKQDLRGAWEWAEGLEDEDLRFASRLQWEASAAGTNPEEALALADEFMTEATPRMKMRMRVARQLGTSDPERAFEVISAEEMTDGGRISMARVLTNQQISKDPQGALDRVQAFALEQGLSDTAAFQKLLRDAYRRWSKQEPERARAHAETLGGSLGAAVLKNWPSK